MQNAISRELQEVVAIIEAPLRPAMINDSLPAILDGAAIGNAAVLLFTSKQCEAQLRKRPVSPNVEIHIYEDFYTNPTLELDLIRLGRSRHISQIIALREFDLLRAARARAALGIPGMDVETVQVFRDKLLMKRRAEASGIAVARYMPIDYADDMQRAGDTFVFPWIVKPRRKAGGMGFRIIRNDGEMRIALQSMAANLSIDEPLDLLAEEFIGTEMFHVDGVWNGSDFVCVSVGRYIGLSDFSDFDPNTSQKIVSGSISIPRDGELFRDICTFANRLLSEFGRNHRFAFHAEVWRRDSRLILNEVACRIGGAWTYYLQNEVFGENADRIHLEVLRQAYDVQLAASNQIHVVAAVPPRVGRYVGIRDQLPPNTRFELFIAEGTEMEQPKKWCDSVGYLISSALTEDQVLAQIENGLAVFERAVSNSTKEQCAP